MSEPLLLSRRLEPAAPDDGAPLLVLSLSADDRQRLRGHGRSLCGRDLLLQLPRGAALEPGERLAGEDGIALVRVEAAPEALLRVRSGDPLTLLRAAYHLGNRHVALELGEGELRLLQDPVLAELVRGLGLPVETTVAPFRPERGAYGSAGHSHGSTEAHGHSHSLGHSHPHSHDDPDGRSRSHSHNHSHPHSPHSSEGHGQGREPGDPHAP